MAWSNTLMVFTKPWKDDSLEALAERIAGLGFQGIELPVRDGYQVNPGNYRDALAKAAAVFAAKKLCIASVAGSIDADLIRVMGQNGIKVLRVMLSADCTRVGMPAFSSASQSASAFINVASIPI